MQIRRTQQITLISILAAISFVLLVFPQFTIIPGVTFLKIEFSIVPAMVALYWLNLSAAIWVIVVRTFLKLILFNEGVNTYLGLPINLAVAVTFVVVFKSCLNQYKLGGKRWQKLMATGCASFAITIVAILVNLGIAIPLYAIFAHFDIVKTFGIQTYLWGMVLPFNLIQGLLWSIVTIVVLTILSPFKKKFIS